MINQQAVAEAAEKAFIYAGMRISGADDETTTQQFADAMQEIVHLGPQAAHGAMCGWCGVILKTFADSQGEQMHGDDGFWLLEAEDLRTGRTVSIDQCTDPATRDVMRIVTCVGNQDHATSVAIVMAAWDNPDDRVLVNLMFRAVSLAAEAALMAHGGGEDGQDA